ncbi:MAG: CBS domain-containing protein [Candidatus Omnitrophica bacterium]|nr:CBS domain-containing protein [Candidatus Omnitrophota bacterium]
MAAMTVKDIMTRNVITVGPDTSLMDVSKLLLEKRISGIPVVNPDGKLVGIITLSDMLKVLDRIYKWKELEKQDSDLKVSGKFEQEKEKARVKDFMTTEILTLKEEDTLDHVRKKMFVNKVHTLPVVNNDRIVGIVGKRDLVKACF